jgi:hypothetical protein
MTFDIEEFTNILSHSGFDYNWTAAMCVTASGNDWTGNSQATLLPWLLWLPLSPGNKVLRRILDQ